MFTLRVNHINSMQDGKTLFEIICMPNGNRCPVVELTPPNNVPVENHNTTLGRDLKWYLEDYLYLPADEYHTRAKDIQSALNKWGCDCFRAIFSGSVQDWYRVVRKSGLNYLTIKVTSDDPVVLSWPWEALYIEDDGYIAQHCHIERQLPNIRETHLLAAEFPHNQLNILYIIARPHGEQDVDYQTLARPLVDFIAEGNWPVQIDLLRPPTFTRLSRALQEKPYHIIHFDGHGGAPVTMKDELDEQSGILVFEKENDLEHEGDLVSADKLSKLLCECNVPYVVLNACQSATFNETSSNPFSSVATSLLRAGVCGVVAMSYSLWIGGAEVFIPAFYRRLFQEGNIAEAIRAGRQEMHAKNMRHTFIGMTEFNDWIVPVLYSQKKMKQVLPKLTVYKTNQECKLPPEVQQLPRSEFIGRSGTIHKLEYAMKYKQAGILLHGMAGAGKTTLLKAFLQWREDTNGLGSGAFWFSFEEIKSAKYVINQLAKDLFGTKTGTMSTEQELAAVTKALKDIPFLIIWDNFESVSGIPSTDVSASLQEDDRKLLKQFLHDLYDGKTKILITSRSQEIWLSNHECSRLLLDGLKGEELWQYCNSIISNLEVPIDRVSATYKKLMDKLAGNPLAVRVILLRLSECPAETLLTELEEEFNGLDGDAGTRRIQAALSVFQRGMDRAFAPALRFIGLHEYFVSDDCLRDMIDRIEEAVNLEDCFSVLENAGLCHFSGNNHYQIHPALRGCLAQLYSATEVEQRIFVDVMGNFASKYINQRLHEQRRAFRLHSVNFYYALRLAHALEMRDCVLSLTQGLGAYARNIRNFLESDRLYKQLAEIADKYGHESIVAVAYHNLGRSAQEKRDFAVAEKHYKKAFTIDLQHGNELGAADTYHQLGRISEEQRDFSVAENWYKKTLEIDLKYGNEEYAASTYHQLGMLAEERRDFVAALDWYTQSLTIKLKYGNEPGAANTYHHMGIVAQKQHDIDAAEDWYNKSLEINLKLGNEPGAALTYHQLGWLYEEKMDFAVAEDLYKKALALKLKNDNEYGAASTYHQLGSVSQKQHDLPTAELFYQKALTIKLKYKNEHSAASTYHGLGMIAQEQQDFDKAKSLYDQALEISNRHQDLHFADIVRELDQPCLE